MNEFLIDAQTLPAGYHRALCLLNDYGEIADCSDWDTRQKEISISIYIRNPLEEPMISKCFIGGYEELQQYTMEMLDGILDFEIAKGNWKYTYHNRMTHYRVAEDEWVNQIDFVIDELRRNPSSRRAVIDIRHNYEDMRSSDPACLQNISYFIRDNKLHCKVLFRSNDAFKATFMNAFALILLQKRIADSLGVGIGSYTHRANSFHCYEKDWDALNKAVRRISVSKTSYDMSYDYVGDWEDMMKDCIPSIVSKVESLKNK